MSYLSFIGIIKIPLEHACSLNISISVLPLLVQFHGEMSLMLALRGTICHLHCEVEHGERWLLQKSQGTAWGTRQPAHLHLFEKSHLRPWAAVQDAMAALVDEVTSNNFSPAAFKWCFCVVYWFPSPWLTLKCSLVHLCQNEPSYLK